MLQGPQLTGLGLGFFLACGVLISLLGARLLPAREYTVYAAFSGVLGVLVLGPASSLEQESSMRRGRVLPMVCRAAVVWAVVVLLVVAPVAGWQARLLGDYAATAVTALAVGAPVVLLLAVLRGSALSRGAFGTVAVAHVVAGSGTLLLPLGLYAGGLRPLTAFVTGAVFAWSPALLLLLLRARPSQAKTFADDTVARETARPTSTAWLILANLLVLVNLLAVPPLLRWHVADLGARPVADAQLLVSVSRLATTCVLGLLPLILNYLGSARTEGAAHPSRRVFVAATGLGLLGVCFTGPLGGVVISLLAGRDTGLSLMTAVLAGVPALLLCQALVLMAVAVSRGRYLLTCVSWATGAVVLIVTATVDPGGRLEVVLCGIVIAALLPLVVFSLGLMRKRRGRSREVQRAAAPAPADVAGRWTPDAPVS